MTITCYSLNELVTVCAALVRTGLTFEADTKALIVTLTGGY